MGGIAERSVRADGDSRVIVECAHRSRLWYTGLCNSPDESAQLLSEGFAGCRRLHRPLHSIYAGRSAHKKLALLVCDRGRRGGYRPRSSLWGLSVGCVRAFVCVRPCVPVMDSSRRLQWQQPCMFLRVCGGRPA